jgi:hypothetical protein
MGGIFSGSCWCGVNGIGWSVGLIERAKELLGWIPNADFAWNAYDAAFWTRWVHFWLDVLLEIEELVWIYACSVSSPFELFL